MQRVLLLAIALATGLVALAIVGFYAYERPTYLRVAVPRGSDSQKLLVALNQQFVQTRANVRMRLRPHRRRPIRRQGHGRSFGGPRRGEIGHSHAD